MKNKVLITFLSVLVLSVLFVACELSEAAQALETAIADAEALAEDAKEGTEPGKYSKTSIDALKAAIKTAQEVLDDASKDDAAKTTAKTTLETAVATFEGSVVLSAAGEALKGAIAAARVKANAAKEGTASGQYPKASIDTFKAAIDDAQAVLVDSSKDDAAKTTAKTTLEAAVTAFEATVN